MNKLITLNKYYNMSNINALQLLANIKDSKKNTQYKPGKNKLELTINGLKTGLYFNYDPFSYGNSKLSNNIMIFSLLPVVTCLNCKDCKKTCYAVKATRQYAEKLLILIYSIWV